MGGLEAIPEIKKFLNAPIVVISTHDTAKMAYEATVKGAMEFFSKDVFTSRNLFKQKEALDALKHIARLKGRLPGSGPASGSSPASGSGSASGSSPGSAAVPSPVRPLSACFPVRAVTSRKINAVVIASSTGGPKALCRLCADLPANFPVPVILVQHNTSGFDRGFVQWLNGYTPLDVRLAEPGETPEKGKLYTAPTDKHLLVGINGFVFNDGEPVNNQKPAADLLFKSAAQYYGASVISVVLTGMGADGAEGTRHIRQAGGITIAQDEESSMIYGMPKAAAETGCVDIVLPLDKIPSKLVALANDQGVE
jgi:two-component system chemotaxis response regulator CheB